MKDFGSRDRGTGIFTPAAVHQRKCQGGGSALAGPSHEKLNTLQRMIATSGNAAEFVDNRPATAQMRGVQEIIHSSSRTRQFQSLGMPPITQKKGELQLKTITVRNNQNDYESGWMQSETRSTGVEDGPQREAQEVSTLLGGNWVGGHMVNDRLGGTGGYDNIVPITSGMNNQHHTIENAAQEKAGDRHGHEVNYKMAITNRKDVTNNGDNVKNLATSFQQEYDYRTMATPEGGTKSRPRPAQPAGPITTVAGANLDMGF